ncbi:tyrosine-type recombinase/integrase (plasmid) [Acidithiobacillus caldus]|uniref:Tyrosine recombinase, phage integrase family n=1 Tax=Acidithiobacillus caldus (strain SM-1) TaxID=990288 RepID=F9ZUL7_ACICS|nr:tyrosine-type recombinase/integrase [Acidithiobacillus caldus]AEK59565.1 tyrosine recombinase, phage integrase family [Acidithiobacillus caldus SM-1]AUW34136.1 tyrosine-type recombinase/integrase [Acidithiobacillus caldus]QER44742.1 Tyrosine recombinase XerD [Acidithiobacillus caldus]
MIDRDALFFDFKIWLTGPNFEVPYSDASIRGYLANVRRFLDFLEDEGIDDMEAISVSIVKKWVIQGKGRIAPPSTQMVRYSALRLFFDWLQYERGFPFHPARALIEEKQRIRQEGRARGGRGGSRPKRLPPVLDLEEIDRLRIEAKRYETIAGYRDAALLDFLLATGLRAQEAVTFPLDALNGYFTGRLRIIGKGNKERLVLFPPPPKASMELWLYVRRRMIAHGDTLFLSDQGKPLTAAMLYMVVRRLLERTGIRKSQTGPHLLRHTAASMWLAQGMDLRRVQENMGHSNIAMTSRYLHLIGTAEQESH